MDNNTKQVIEVFNSADWFLNNFISMFANFVSKGQIWIFLTME